MEENKCKHITPARYPVGDATFADIRRQGKVYVDKTEMIYSLVKSSKYVFLSRPRRFGKSLLLSTLKAYFEGRRELFTDLAIDRLESDWERYPVIHISLAVSANQNIEQLRAKLIEQVRDNAVSLGVQVYTSAEPYSQFYELIVLAANKYARNVVVLIDEYDKPLLDTMHSDRELYEAIRDELRPFYTCLKDRGEYIRFAMLTGISKFSQVNVFSGLNNLTDISLTPEYNTLCGISQQEMDKYFACDMEVFAHNNNMTVDVARQQFKELYDGYHFAKIGDWVYNPYSVLKAFWHSEFGLYWFESGLSLYMVKELAERNIDFEAFEGIKASTQQMMGSYVPGSDPLPLLYQSGYLTIKDYDSESWMYTLGYPNREVSSGVFDELLKVIVPREDATRFNATSVRAKAIEGNPDGLMELLNIGLQSYNYEQLDAPRTEKHMVIMLHALCMAMGLNVDGEVHTARGRIDMVIQTKRFIYLIEFKINSYPRRALLQIDKLGYAERFEGDSRRVFKIGANYSTTKRKLTGWLIE